MKPDKSALLAGLLALAAAGSAFALKSDKDKPSNIDANYQKSVQSRTGAANDPDITDFEGNVVITKGTIRMTAAHARMYAIPSGSKVANAGKVSRVVLTGSPAHMQQIHDGDCSLVQANAATIDYKPLTSLAELTGNVVVNQAGRGEFRGEHMLYNTDTGDMEGGDASSAGRVHMVMEPGGAKPAASGGCGEAPAAAPPKSAAPAKEKNPAKPAASPFADKPASGA